MIKSAKKSRILQKKSENQISNPNSPIENEKIMNEIENKKNQGRIDLEIQTPDDKFTSDVFGPNYKKNQQSLREFKNRQYQTEFAVPMNTQNQKSQVSKKKMPGAQGQGE